MAKSKELAKFTTNNDAKGSNSDNNNQNQEELVMKTIYNIFGNYNLPLYDRLINDINALIELERNNKVNYIIFKKLEIREDWLIEKKVEIASE